ncbi:hypothetical protein Vadar_018314 [Vaccinium darrowii]|uniref:Uncharacterized protein n=1 Tax=Vaccinium darrowii TaxID=229202 RepID=A0ACB7XS56_9ERIC|nr:hypothetical protein Vadar_018314 [Vaccinium darrowii]
MIGPLTTLSATSLGFSLSRRHLSHHPERSFAVRNPCKATIHATAVETRKAWSLYEVLRVRRNASKNEIEAAYRSLAKKHHPDSRGFIEIHDAYTTLSDPTARALYNLSLKSVHGV